MFSQTGAIADILWYEIKNHAKNIELGEFVVMPNHIDGVIILHGNNNKTETPVGGELNEAIGANETNNSGDNNTTLSMSMITTTTVIPNTITTKTITTTIT